MSQTELELRIHIVAVLQNNKFQDLTINNLFTYQPKLQGHAYAKPDFLFFNKKQTKEPQAV